MLAALGYCGTINCFTSLILFKRDLMAKDAVEEWLRFNIDTMRRRLSAA